MAEQPFDVRRAIEQSSSKSTLQELARKGIRRVKVLDERMINKLIGEAVERILSTKTNLMSDDDRSKIIADSRKELDRLMGEFQATKDKADLMEQDKSSLATQVENLQDQVKKQRNLTEQTGKQRFEDGRNSMNADMDELRKSNATAVQEASERAKSQFDEHLQTKMAQSQALIDEAKSERVRVENGLREELAGKDQEIQARTGDVEQVKADLTRRENEIRREFDRREKELREELEKQKEKEKAESVDQARQKIKADYEKREQILREEMAEIEKDLKSRAYDPGVEVAKLKEEQARREQEQRELFEKREKEIREEYTSGNERQQQMVDQMMSDQRTREQDLRERLDLMQSKNIEMSEKNTQLLEDMKKSEDTLFSKMSDLFSKSIDGVNRKLGDLRMRSFAGGGGGGGGMGQMEGDVDFRPSQATLEDLVATELTTNLKSMKVESKTAGKLGNVLDRLKALRGGGKSEEKK